MRGARVAIVVAVVVAMGAAVAMGVGRGKRKSAPTRARVPLAAGGAAVEEAADADAGGDAGGALVEDARRYDVKTWSFALDRHDLRIEDVGMGTALDAILERTGAELVVNGGFF